MKERIMDQPNHKTSLACGTPSVRGRKARDLSLDLTVPLEALSLSEAAKTLKLGRTTFYRYIEQGKIAVERVDRDGQVIYNIYQKPSQPQAALDRTASEREATMESEAIPNVLNLPAQPVRLVEEAVSHAGFTDEWIEWRDEGIGTKNWSKNHKKRSVALMKKYFQQWDTVTPESAELFLLQTPVTSYSTRRCKHAAFSSFAKFLTQKKKMMDRATYFEIKALYPKKPKDYKREIKVIHEEHIEPILKAIAEVNAHDSYKVVLLRSLVIFLSETGVRISEAAGLVHQNMGFDDDLEQAYIHLPEHITKNGKERYVPFSAEAQAAVKEYLRVRPKETPLEQVFLFDHWAWGSTTLKPTSVAHNFKKVSDHCGIPFSAHAFRHYRITQWANDPGIAITDVQYWAGHETLMVTQGYIHIRGRHSIKAAYASKAPQAPQAVTEPVAADNNRIDKLVNLLEKMEHLGLPPEEKQKVFLQLATL